MADYKNGGRKTQKNVKTNASPVFNRSLTINSYAAAAENKQLYNLYGSQTFERNGSIKNLHGSAGNSLKGNVRKLCSLYESPKLNSFNSQSSPSPSPSHTSTNSNNPNIIPKNVPFSSNSRIRLPGTEDRVVIYFTSLRGIRRTFQDCHSVRMVFRGFRVNLDERDVSMDVGYRKELQKVLGEKENVSLPQVFIKGKYVGGADLVMQLLEVGELARMIKGLPLRALKPCDACDDMRFVMCANCGGSRKLLVENEERMNRCPDCNENGLVRCPLCCS